MVCLDTTISTIIKEIDSSFGMHADISGWQNVWSDAGSGNKKDYNIWKGVPLTPEFEVSRRFVEFALKAMKSRASMSGPKIQVALGWECGSTGEMLVQIPRLLSS
eukprot:TRINITY_DN4263_c0_g2_i4.p1 TRINITY_DN4263_c0_g2~~TRINITY_DN4263_c0_g2_i4.p1  ORF type:complete len:105 (+),score=11.12 TRINITY_DN4263_c0_g2_i4:585-899(+)